MSRENTKKQRKHKIVPCGSKVEEMCRDRTRRALESPPEEARASYVPHKLIAESPSSLVFTVLTHLKVT